MSARRTSALPRPKPLMTSPLSLSGNGDSGVSGPAIGSRGPDGGGMAGLRWVLRKGLYSFIWC